MRDNWNDRTCCTPLYYAPSHHPLNFIGQAATDPRFSTEPTGGGRIPKPRSAQKWINLNSFAARILGHGLEHWDSYAIWELRAALEEPTKAKSIMNCEVAAAAEWILHAEERLTGMFHEDVGPVVARETEPGALYQGKAGLCRARWAFWKMRFAEIGNSKQVDEDVGEVALRAAQKMRTVEPLEV